MKYSRLKYSSFINEKDISYIPFDESFVCNETLIMKLPEWLTNFRVNLETIGCKETISNLAKIDGPALIIDHPFSGSFERQAEYLKKYKGVSFCCDRALYKCLEYDFIPTYVVNVDSSYLCMSFFDRPDVRKVMDKVTAIFANTTFPLTIRCWSGRRVFFTPLFEWSITESMSAMSRTDVINTGGCVHNTCFSIAYALGADPIAIYGIDNSYDKIEQTEYPDVEHKEYYVEELKRSFIVDPVYEYYAKKMFQWISSIKRKTINTTQNGIMYNSVSKMFGYKGRIKKMKLSEFVGEF